PRPAAKLRHLPVSPLSMSSAPTTATLIIAPLWRRLAAIMYDSIVLLGIWVFTSFLVLAAFGIENAQVAQGSNVFYRYTVFATMLGTAFLFFGWFWTHSGQTIGMQAWKIKVQNADGSAISWLQVAQRYVIAPFALLALALGYLWMLFDAERRTWPDMVSRSIVVMSPHFPRAA
ncbi:MAG: RDD family protein, partial [Pseudomonadota bacterium]